MPNGDYGIERIKTVSFTNLQKNHLTYLITAFDLSRPLPCIYPGTYKEIDNYLLCCKNVGMKDRDPQKIVDFFIKAIDKVIDHSAGKVQVGCVAYYTCTTS